MKSRRLSFEQSRKTKLYRDVVHESYDNLSHTITDTFITLQAVMREILRTKGGNEFKVPQLKKQCHRRKGKEIQWVHCDRDTLEEAERFLRESNDE